MHNNHRANNRSVRLGSWLISDLSNISKIALVIGMVLGRLEILVVLSLITYGLRVLKVNLIMFLVDLINFEYFGVSQIIKGKAPIMASDRQTYKMRFSTVRKTKYPLRSF